MSLKISIDIDGTYTEYPDTFDALAVMLQMSGHEVGILTARDKEENYLEVGFEPDFEYYLGLKDDEFSEPEKCMEKTVKIQEEEIDLHFDDEYELFPDYIKDQVIEIE